MEEDDKCLYASELSKCVNCKFNIGGICSQSINKEKTSPGLECFNGYFEPLDISLQLYDTYKILVDTIDYYMDLPLPTKNIIALWIMGTYFHEHFNTYPYLFINAMRGSGKTRLMKIISTFAKQGQLTNSLTEAVMFRTTGTLCIDEFEGVGGKDKQALRELLNSAYKKGTKIFRMRKKKGLDGETQVVEDFEPYRPVCMANIWGMEEVLGDRCISVILEKSGDESKTKLVENFSELFTVKPVKETLEKLNQCRMCSVCMSRNMYKQWNAFIKARYTLHTSSTLPTLSYTSYTENEKTADVLETNQVFHKDFDDFFKQVDEISLEGRSLELFLPLLMVAKDIDEGQILTETLINAKKLVEDKKVDEVAESKDVMVYSLVSKESSGEWKEIAQLTSLFRLVVGGGENEWLTSEWIGRALKRLCLVSEKRRTSQGMQVKLNVAKAKEKLEMFK